MRSHAKHLRPLSVLLILTITLSSLALASCTSPRPNLNSIPPGKYKNLATQLAARTPKADATAFAPAAPATS